MCQAIDEGRLIDLASDQVRTAAQRAEVAGMVRDLARRLDAAAAARRHRSAELKLARNQAAVEACLHRSAELKLSMDELRADPRVAAALEGGLSAGAPASPAEVAAELYASMGLAPRPATPYEAAMPPVGDLARTIGLRS